MKDYSYLTEIGNFSFPQPLRPGDNALVNEQFKQDNDPYLEERIAAREKAAQAYCK